MIEYEIEIEGTTSLLFNRFIDSSIDTKVKKRSGSPMAIDAAQKLYKTPGGDIYTPATHIYGMLINAAKAFRVTGKGKATYSKLLGSAIEITPEAITHKIQQWEPFTIAAVNPITRGRMIVTRPMLPKWGVEFRAKFNEEDIPTEVLKQILEFGGQYVGIGDWRPEKKGKYGKFIVTRFAAIKP